MKYYNMYRSKVIANMRSKTVKSNLIKNFANYISDSRFELMSMSNSNTDINGFMAKLQTY